MFDTAAAFLMPDVAQQGMVPLRIYFTVTLLSPLIMAVSTTEPPMMPYDVQALYVDLIILLFIVTNF